MGTGGGGQVWSLWGAVVVGNGAVEEAVVWQDSTQTYVTTKPQNYGN